MITRKEFTEQVERLIIGNRTDVMSAILKVCEVNNVEPEGAKRLLSVPLREVSVITMSGEYIGKLVDDKNLNEGVELADPRIIVNGPDGKMGFAKGIAVTGIVNPTNVRIQNYVFMTETNDDIVNAYTTAVSGITTPKKKKIIVNQ